MLWVFEMEKKRRRGRDCFVQKKHYFILLVFTKFLRSKLPRRSPGNLPLRLHRTFTSRRPPAPLLHRCSSEALGASGRRWRPPVVCSLTTQALKEKSQRSCLAAGSIVSHLHSESQRQIFRIDGRTRCQARVAVRPHGCRGICFYSQAHE